MVCDNGEEDAVETVCFESNPSSDGMGVVLPGTLLSKTGTEKTGMMGQAEMGRIHLPSSLIDTTRLFAIAQLKRVGSQGATSYSACTL